MFSTVVMVYQFAQHDSPILYIISGDGTRQYSIQTTLTGVVVPPPSYADVYGEYDIKPRKGVVVPPPETHEVEATTTGVVVLPPSYADVYGEYDIEPRKDVVEPMKQMPKTATLCFFRIS